MDSRRRGERAERVFEKQERVRRRKIEEDKDDLDLCGFKEPQLATNTL